MSSSFILFWWVKCIFLCLNNKILIELIVPELKQSLIGYSVHVPLCPKAKYTFLMHQSIWSFNILPFPLDNPREFYCFPCPRSGEFEPSMGGVGRGGIWTSGMRDFWFYNIFWSHRELFIKNCAWLGHLNAILAHGGQEFQQTYLQKFKCPGGCLWEGCYSFKLIDALQSRLETCTIAVYPLLLQ